MFNVQLRKAFHDLDSKSAITARRSPSVCCVWLHQSLFRLLHYWLAKYAQNSTFEFHSSVYLQESVMSS